MLLNEVEFDTSKVHYNLGYIKESIRKMTEYIDNVNRNQKKGYDFFYAL